MIAEMISRQNYCVQCEGVYILCLCITLLCGQLDNVTSKLRDVQHVIDHDLKTKLEKVSNV